MVCGGVKSTTFLFGGALSAVALDSAPNFLSIGTLHNFDRDILYILPIVFFP